MKITKRGDETHLGSDSICLLKHKVDWSVEGNHSFHSSFQLFSCKTVIGKKSHLFGEFGADLFQILFLCSHDPPVSRQGPYCVNSVINTKQLDKMNKSHFIVKSKQRKRFLDARISGDVIETSDMKQKVEESLAHSKRDGRQQWHNKPEVSSLPVQQLASLLILSLFLRKSSAR